MKAFVLGAGLGTRLRPLTERRPKPLVPIYGKPLITFAFDHLIANGAASFVINTHHCPEAYESLRGGGPYRGHPLTFQHEPVLLDTGGGIKNVGRLIGNEPFVVYNGDVLADFPLRPAITSHLASGNIATLILRSSGGPLHVQCRDGRVSDIRNVIRNSNDPSFLFTGISLLSPEIFR
ncbi:MAG: sugar phosphate nucleotidyltransferase, partial [Verrucomicrobiae bacterium]